jgi:hypothetical protein
LYFLEDGVADLECWLPQENIYEAWRNFYPDWGYPSYSCLRSDLYDVHSSFAIDPIDFEPLERTTPLRFHLVHQFLLTLVRAFILPDGLYRCAFNCESSLP